MYILYLKINHDEHKFKITNNKCDKIIFIDLFC